jgi:uncharacterized protein YkwD
LLKSTNPSERARFYTVVGKLPPEENEKCVRQLREAWDFHKAALVQAAAGLGGPQGSWGLFTKGRAEWRAAADLLTKAIATDWHKDAAKVAELTRELTRCARLHDRMRSAARTAEKTDLARLLAGCAVLVEIDQQTAYALTQGGTFKADPMATLLRAVGDSPEVAAKIKELTDFLAADKAFAEAERWNSTQRWAGAEQKRFATMLNEARWVVEYQPLRLDEKLCAASQGHSKEMVALGYFSHDSPVAKNKGFGERARNAGFEGGAQGECIYFGSRSPQAAFAAWWASDGHRFVMFSAGANTLGVASAGAGTWTLNTGAKNWPAPAQTPASIAR